jgi:hypothetical protein
MLPTQLIEDMTQAALNSLVSDEATLLEKPS